MSLKEKFIKKSKADILLIKKKHKLKNINKHRKDLIDIKEFKPKVILRNKTNETK